ncbi:MAG: glycoside hydrolase TIM-barrel-like domain-containing protein, partial [Beijerinckiaceae bacterium]|nr:glycoside hydrolase TIM-barrel-like domain-containing protein [Beijerinckiaceae bacterium]
MSYVNGVNLLPATGEFTYATTAHRGQRLTETSITGINFYQTGDPDAPDFPLAIDQLEAAFPACTTVSVICAWLGDSTDASLCRIYPSTTYGAGVFQRWTGASWVAANWQCSSLTEGSIFSLIPISSVNGIFTYGGTPSDQSIVECITELKARGFRVVFYPFILMDDPGKSWRGRISFSPDKTSAAAMAVSDFLGSAVPADFTQDFTNKTVAYAGAVTDYTFRRMILHYANLCVVAGGVDLFVIGSELRGLETIRGPAWTKAGAVDGGGKAVWDYPFVDGLITLADDVRGIFDAASLTKDLSGFHNLITYAADWSSWMGYQHQGEDGQWPHLDRLWAQANIDLVAFDNYLPISDWTTGTGGIDVLNWAKPKPASWPPGPDEMSGLGLTGTPSLYSKEYLKANIEGGEKFNWFYFDTENLGRGLDPNGSDLQVSRPQGDRLTQTRSRFFPNQEILGNKQLRWWWKNTHKAVYDTGSGFEPQGPDTQWVAQSKSIIFTEYGFPANDKSTNQPNLFFDSGSTESGTAFWSIWVPAEGHGGYLPKPDQTISLLALQAIYEYWFIDGHNETSGGGLNMLEPAFCAVWNWDARPFPAFPWFSNVWGDAGNWQAGNWLNGKGPFILPPLPEPLPGVPMPLNFPNLPGLAWSVHKCPTFATRVAQHVSGREVRAPFFSQSLYEFELTIEGMDSGGAFPGLGAQSLQSLMGLYLQCQGQYGTFLFTDPTDKTVTSQAIGSGNGTKTAFTFQRTLGGATEPAPWVTSVGSVYLNGVDHPSLWALAVPNTLNFTNPPLGAPTFAQKLSED